MFLKQPRIFEDYLYYGNYNFSYYSFFLRGYKGLKVVTICYYKYLQHPEEMNRETLYDLRALLALYPYYQTARLLMLKNLYLLHDPSFDEELRRAAIYITDRKIIFEMV